MSFLLGLPILVIILICVVGFFIHFLPVFIAGSRHAQNFWWIFLINLFFGWTLIGWVIALVWALQDRPRYAYGYVPPYNR
jgi:nitrogen fixation/metabolism regulation signal transduction histidine kinase